MKRHTAILIPALVLVLLVIGAGCTTVKPIDVDYGREAFLKGEFQNSEELLRVAKKNQIKRSQKPFVAIWRAQAAKTFVRGEYAGMYRDQLLLRFYSALDYLALEKPARALTELGTLRSLLDNMDISVSQVSSEGVSRELQEITGAYGKDTVAVVAKELNAYDAKAKSQSSVQQPEMAAFYHSPVFVLGAFLEACLQGRTEEFGDFCGRIQALGLAQNTLSTLQGNLKNQVLVLAAVGKGPVLAERKIGFTGAKLLAFTNLPAEKVALTQVKNPADFNPRTPVIVEADGHTHTTEIAANLYASLAADFALVKNRLYWEQIVRVIVRDLLAEGVIVGTAQLFESETVKTLYTMIANVVWFFGRQAMLEPDLRCLQYAPWNYQTALVPIPKDRLLTCRYGQETVQVPIPKGWQNAVLYLNCQGHITKGLTPILMRVK